MRKREKFNNQGGVNEREERSRVVSYRSSNNAGPNNTRSKNKGSVHSGDDQKTPDREARDTTFICKHRQCETETSEIAGKASL